MDINDLIKQSNKYQQQVKANPIEFELKVRGRSILKYQIDCSFTNFIVHDNWRPLFTDPINGKINIYAEVNPAESKGFKTVCVKLFEDEQPLPDNCGDYFTSNKDENGEYWHIYIEELI